MLSNNIKRTSATIAMATALTAPAYGKGFTADELQDFLGSGRMLNEDSQNNGMFGNMIHEMAEKHHARHNSAVKKQQKKKQNISSNTKRVTAKQRLVAAREFWQHMPWFRYFGLRGNWHGRRLQSVNKRAKPIFALFDSNKNGKVEPKEIFKAYYTMNQSSNPQDELKNKDFQKAMDGSLRKFCGVGPATPGEADIFKAMFKNRRQGRRRSGGKNRRQNRRSSQNNNNGRSSRRGSSRRGQRNRNSRNNNGGNGPNNWSGQGRRGQRNRNSRNNNNGSNNWSGQGNGNGQFGQQLPPMPPAPQDQFGNQGSSVPNNNSPITEFIEEQNFEMNGGMPNGRGLRAKNNYYNSGRNSYGRRGNSRRSRRGGYNNRSQYRKRSGRKNYRRGGISQKMQKLKRRMSLYGLLDTDHNQSISLFEFFKPFSSADTNKDYKVTRKELSKFLVKHERRICMAYRFSDRIKRQESWFKKGVRAAVGNQKKRNVLKKNTHNMP